MGRACLLGVQCCGAVARIGDASRTHAHGQHGAPLGNEATWDLFEVSEGPKLVARQTAGLGVAEEDHVDRRVMTRALDTERPPRARAGFADQPQAYVIVLHYEWWAKLELRERHGGCWFRRSQPRASSRSGHEEKFWGGERRIENPIKYPHS